MLSPLLSKDVRTTFLNRTYEGKVLLNKFDVASGAHFNR
jgi:hypothetical protein